MLMCVMCVMCKNKQNPSSYRQALIHSLGERSKYLDKAREYFPKYEEQFDELLQLLRSDASRPQE